MITIRERQIIQINNTIINNIRINAVLHTHNYTPVFAHPFVHTDSTQWTLAKLFAVAQEEQICKMGTRVNYTLGGSHFS